MPATVFGRRLFSRNSLVGIVLLEIFVVHQIIRTIEFDLVEVLDLIGSKPFINGSVQYCIGINFSQRLGPFQRSPEISRLTSIVLRLSAA